MRTSSLFLLLFAFLSSLNGQEGTAGSQEILEAEMEETVSRYEEESGFAEATERLIYLKRNPLNLNSVSREELEQLYILNDFQIFSLLDYRANFGNFATVSELRYLPGFTDEIVSRVQDYFIAEVPSAALPGWKEALQQGRSRYYARFQQSLEKPDGYDREEGYLGNRAKLWSRYEYSYKNTLRAGMTLEKDPGEPIPAGKGIKLFDFQSAYIRVSDLGNLKSLSLGDYNIRLGQGLVCWTGYGSTKGGDPLNIRRRADGIGIFSSSEENRFFRGAAATINLGKVDATFFYSSKQIDANVFGYDPDKGRAEGFTSFRTDGFHGTEWDLREKDVLGESIAGANLTWNGEAYRIGANWMQTRYDAEYWPVSEVYNHYVQGGSHFTNGSLDYQFRYRILYFFGETAISPGSEWATVNGVGARLHPSFTLVMLYRNYAPGYMSFTSRGFGESYKTSNEKGFYTGIRLLLPQHLSLEGFSDFYSFPWLKYGVDAPSSGLENSILLSWNPSQKFSMQLRYRQEKKWMNSTLKDITHSLVETERKGLRWQASHQINDQITFRVRLESSMWCPGEGKREKSRLMYEDVQWKASGIPFSISLRYSLFDAGSYDSRIYTYERDLLYAYSIPSFYGKGSRTYLMSSFTLGKRMDFWLRISRSFYANRNSIGSDIACIQGNHRTDIGAQVRIKF